MKSVLLFAIAVLFCVPANAHMHDRPDLNTWFNGLMSSGGSPCCAFVDGSTIADVDWDTTVVDGKVHYRVFVEGQWIVVTDEEVVKEPNRYGPSMVWIYHTSPMGGPMQPAIRCFMPGAGG